MGDKVANPKYIKLLKKVPNYQEMENTRGRLLDQSVKEKIDYGTK